MKSLFFRIVAADLRLIFRDQTLLVFMISPLLLLLFVKFAVPPLAQYYPVLKEYYLPITMFGSIQSSILFGFLSAFLIIEDKDQQVMNVHRVLPVNPSHYILARMFFFFLLSTFGAWLVLAFGGLTPEIHAKTLLLAVQAGLVAPTIALLIGTFAQNKIEAMAYFKGIDLVLLLPVLSLFISSGWKYALSLFPSFWIYQSYNEIYALNGEYIFTLTSAIVQLSAIVLLTRLFRQRIFNR
ncbi:MAG: ABC transporter permease [Flavobacteriales bacterium]|nr:ABC transporter permease [Flavobacteriales bacterium]